MKLLNVVLLSLSFIFCKPVLASPMVERPAELKENHLTITHKGSLGYSFEICDEFHICSVNRLSHDDMLKIKPDSELEKSDTASLFFMGSGTAIVLVALYVNPFTGLLVGLGSGAIVVIQYIKPDFFDWFDVYHPNYDKATQLIRQINAFAISSSPGDRIELVVDVLILPEHEKTEIIEDRKSNQIFKVLQRFSNR